MKINRYLLSALICAGAVWAQDTQIATQFSSQVDPQDPPSRVARLNRIDGQVSFEPAAVSEWTAATLNYPVTIGDHLYADTGGRAEMHIGSTAIRVGPRSSMSFLNLDDRTVQIRLDEGALIVRIKYLDADDYYEIDTAQGSISLLRQGEYRIDTDQERDGTMVTVRTGEAEVTANGGSFNVNPHTTAFFGSDGRPEFQRENPNDAFDLWAMDLDRREDRLPAPRYVSSDMEGWQDLDSSGTWSDDPDYGPMWRPRLVDAGWAPYRYGHWAWVEPWGWTWIDDASWGFAPFHYGRWAYAGGGWAWVPGPVVRRPVYAPALVAFVGGRNWSLSVTAGGGVGAVAWFPLGPREAFVPRYHGSPRYVNRVNTTNIHMTNVNITNVTVNRVYVNQTVGVTVVDHRAFVSAQSVHRSLITVPRDVAARAEVLGTAPSVVPEHSSVLARSGGPANVPHPAAAVLERPVYAHRPPPPAAVPFGARQQALQANPGRPVDPQTMNQLRVAAPVREHVIQNAGPGAAAPVFRQSQGVRPADNPPANQPATRFGRPGIQQAPAPNPQYQNNPDQNSRPAPRPMDRPAPQQPAVAPAAPVAPAPRQIDGQDQQRRQQPDVQRQQDVQRLERETQQRQQQDTQRQPDQQQLRLDQQRQLDLQRRQQQDTQRLERETQQRQQQDTQRQPDQQQQLRLDQQRQQDLQRRQQQDVQRQQDTQRLERETQQRQQDIQRQQQREQQARPQPVERREEPRREAPQAQPRQEERREAPAPAVKQERAAEKAAEKENKKEEKK